MDITDVHDNIASVTIITLVTEATTMYKVHNIVISCR